MKLGGLITMVMCTHILSLYHMLSLLALDFVMSFAAIISNENLNYPWINIGSHGIHIILVTTLFGVCITYFCRGYMYITNSKSKSKTIMILQSESLLVSDILDNTFLNVTLDKNFKSLPLLGGSLPGDSEQNP